MIRWHTETRKSVTSKNYFFSFFLDETQGLLQKFSLQAAETAVAQVTNARIKRLAEKRSVQFQRRRNNKIMILQYPRRGSDASSLQVSWWYKPPHPYLTFIAHIPFGLVVWERTTSNHADGRGQSINEVYRRERSSHDQSIWLQTRCIHGSRSDRDCSVIVQSGVRSITKNFSGISGSWKFNCQWLCIKFQQRRSKDLWCPWRYANSGQSRPANSDLYQTIYPTVVNPMQKSSEADSRQQKTLFIWSRRAPLVGIEQNSKLDGPPVLPLWADS